jgi:hypothetical protein
MNAAHPIGLYETRGGRTGERLVYLSIFEKKRQNCCFISLPNQRKSSDINRRHLTTSSCTSLLPFFHHSYYDYLLYPYSFTQAQMGYFRILAGQNILGIEENIAWATPGQFTTVNYPCDEDGTNCGPQTQHYVDPSTNPIAVQRRLTLLFEADAASTKRLETLAR